MSAPVARPSAAALALPGAAELAATAAATGVSVPETVAARLSVPPRPDMPQSIGIKYGLLPPIKYVENINCMPIIPCNIIPRTLSSYGGRQNFCSCGLTEAVLKTIRRLRHCGTLFQSSCVLLTSTTDCSDDS